MSEKDHDVTKEIADISDTQSNSVDGGSSKCDDLSSGTNSASMASQSSPIEIRQAASGKFGVLHARQPRPMTDINGEPVSFDKLIKTANTMSSMMMAHKIALEDDFKLEPGMDIGGPLMSLSPIIGSSPSRGGNSGQSKGEGPSLHNRVKDIVHEAFWDLFRKELDSQSSEDAKNRKFDQTRQLLCDVKLKILELLLPQHARLKQDLEDKLDPQIIFQLTKCNSLSLIDYGRYILSVLAKLCAPVRDEKLKELSEQQDIVLLYRGIMEMLELMRVDFANFTLNKFKPHIKAHSHDYERDKFNEILTQQKNIGIDGLEYTRVWLDRSVKKIDAIQGIADLVSGCEESVDLSSVGIEETMAKTENDSKRSRILGSDVVNRTLNTAYCELLEWTPQTQKLYPETLLFDEATFKSLGEQYETLLLAASILLTTSAFLRSFKLHEDNDFKVLIKSHIITLLTAGYERSSTTASGSLNTDSVSNRLTESLDQIKLETIATKLCEDIKKKLEETNKTLLEQFDNQRELLNRQILDLQSSSNRVRELTRRRILEFVETLLDLDVKHQQKKFASKMPPPINIPLGLNCLTDEITLTMAQLVKIIRYNRKVFYQHYQDIIVDIVSHMI